MYAYAEPIVPDLHYLRRQNYFSFNFYRNENQFFFLHVIPLYLMNWYHIATNLKLSSFYP